MTVRPDTVRPEDVRPDGVGPNSAHPNSAHPNNVRPDNRLADAPMVPVTCRACGAGVLVRKSSWEQTSVQWDAEGSAQCRQRRDARLLAARGGSGLFLGCSELSASILDAVGRGAVHLVDELP